MDDAGTRFLVIPLLECKEAIGYTLPSFPVITVDVVRIRYQAYTENSTASSKVLQLDGFIPVVSPIDKIRRFIEKSEVVYVTTFHHVINGS